MLELYVLPSKCDLVNSDECIIVKNGEFNFGKLKIYNLNKIKIHHKNMSFTIKDINNYKFDLSFISKNTLHLWILKKESYYSTFVMNILKKQGNSYETSKMLYDLIYYKIKSKTNLLEKINPQLYKIFKEKMEDREKKYDDENWADNIFDDFYEKYIKN